MNHLAAWVRRLRHHLQHKKRAFDAPLPISTAAETPQSSSQQASKAP